jgi:hypothetical protein
VVPGCPNCRKILYAELCYREGIILLNLESVEAQWMELFDTLCCDPRVKEQIAPPFLSVPALETRSILYVGKATAKDGCWDEIPSGSTPVRIQQGREYTKKFLIDVAPDLNSRFWHFARELNTEVAKKWNQQLLSPFQHITWTNVCKIGVLKGNPKGSLFAQQRKLAIETLRIEIELYKPQFICFVTGDYGDGIIGEVVGDPKAESWDKTEEKSGFWARRAANGLPAVLWTYHPQGKSTELIETWLKAACKLLPD